MHRQNKVRMGILLLTAAVAVSSLSFVTAGQDAPRPERVMGSLFIGIDTTRPIQLSTKKKIKSASIERPSIARLEDSKEANIARITGVQAGLTYLELVDPDDNREFYQIIVEPDLEYIRHLVQTRVPGSSVTIDSAGQLGMLVSGTVDSPEVVQTIIDTVQLAVPGGKVVNNMRVIGVQQVQLCVVVAEVSRNKLRNMSFAWDETGPNHFVGSALGLQSGVAQTSSILPGAAGGATAASLVGAPANLFVGLVNDKAAFWGFFQALKNESLLKLLAEPTLNC